MSLYGSLCVVTVLKWDGLHNPLPVSLTRTFTNHHRKALDQEIVLSENGVKGKYSGKGIFASGLWDFRWWSKVGEKPVLFEEQSWSSSLIRIRGGYGSEEDTDPRRIRIA